MRLIVRRVVASRVNDADLVDDVVQETLTRLLLARRRLDDHALAPYAIVVARNLLAAHWRQVDTDRRHLHRLHDPREPETPDAPLAAHEEAEAVRAALHRLSPSERHVLVAHEVAGQATASLADDAGTTAGAVAAKLNRSRAKLRVEYLLERTTEPPTERCRSVLLALSAGDRRRQAELDAGYHLLDCQFCADLSESLLDRRASGVDTQIRVPVGVDADVVIARQRGHDLARRTGFSQAEATIIATAISEIARNIVRFARRGEMTMAIVADGDAAGLTVVARDAGPGIVDIDQAFEVGYTTYGGRGLGLPGCRRLMDEFDITSQVGRGTTITMTKWRRG